ncbi:hypothetical protein OPQ81_005034 [Rhizoctonia solani]|nr:hypothetical protein OPQ81_005034 [Rhizoctonia solani]
MEALVDQAVNLTLSGGQVEPVPLAVVDMTTSVMVTKCTGYGVEIGASVVMLAVILTMTPRTKFWRFPTYLNIAGLCNNIIRVILLAVYFDSSWVTFYAMYSNDFSFVSRTDYANSITSSVMTIPQNIMMMWALILQAWSMIKLWPDSYKWAILIFSYQIIQLEVSPAEGYELIIKYAWVRYCFLGLEVACICWFCFLFMCKLVTHLWKNRSFLPNTKGLGAMDASSPVHPCPCTHTLYFDEADMTSPLLSLPVFFAGLQYSGKVQFEPGSLLYTSVLVVMPLGTLVAQRIADPAAFNSEVSGTARNTLLDPAWSQSSHDSSFFPGGQRRGSNAVHRKTGVTATVSSMGHLTSGGPSGSTDIELARIDANFEAGRVRIDHAIQRSEEVL